MDLLRKPLILYQSNISSQQPLLTSTDLPSNSYQFSRWFELEGQDSADKPCAGSLTGSTLRSLRVREGPANVTSLFASHSVMYCKKNEDWKDYQSLSEDWEHVESVNLSYQDLGDEYQLKNLYRCLNQMVKCKHLQLMDNSLTDLKRATLSNCIHLNLSRNQFSSFKSLPKAPKLEHLSLADNNITSLKSLSSLARNHPHLKMLVLRGSPVADSCDYRYRVFQGLPNLELLDGHPPLPSNQGLSIISQHHQF